jgi:ankyrin repeat protein
MKPALCYAVDRPEPLTWFLDRGADSNIVGSDGLTPLDAAAGLATPDAIDVLVSKGARLGIAIRCIKLLRDIGLGMCVSTKMIDYFQRLLAISADINVIQF